MEFLSALPVQFMVISSIVLIMIFLFGVFLYITVNNKKQDYIKIDAEIIEVVKTGDDSDSSPGMYFPILRYEYNGEVYEESVNYLVSHESLLKVGSKIKVSITEDDPHNVQLVMNSRFIFMFIFIFIFIVMIFSILVFMGSL